MNLIDYFHKYKDTPVSQLQDILNNAPVDAGFKSELVELIQCHQNLTEDDDVFAKSLAVAADELINQLNEKEWVGKHIGPYKLERIIGTGGTGAVFLAKRTEIYDKTVAIKLIDPEITRMIGEVNVLNEAKVMALLEHESIAKILDSGVLDNGVIYFIMEYIDGYPLSVLIKKRVPLNNAIYLTIDICSAITQAHDLQLTHKDIKPDNILVDARTGKIKIIDFGLSEVKYKLKSSNSTAPIDAQKVISVTGENGNTDSLFALSKAYASPEQIKNTTLTSRSDVYSIGCVFFELLTGEQLHTVLDSKSDIVRDKRNIGKAIPEITWLDKFPKKELAAILEKVTNDDINLRYKSADVFSHDLIRFLQRRPVLAYKPLNINLYHAYKMIVRKPLMVTLSSLAIITLVSVSAFTQYQIKALKAEKSNVQQVQGRLKNLLVYADPRERLGNNISFKDILVEELSALEKDTGMSDDVKYELLMTIGDGLFGQSKELSALKAYKLAIDLVKKSLGTHHTKTIKATVKLMQTYAQINRAKPATELIKPYAIDFLSKKIENVELAKMYIIFDQLNARYFNDSYAHLRFQKPDITLKDLAVRFKDELSISEYTVLQLTILERDFFSIKGDYITATAHKTEQEVVEHDIPFLKKLTPEIDKLISTARLNRNTQYLLPSLLGFRARISAEIRDYQSVDVFYKESIMLAEKFFKSPDSRLSDLYKLGAVVYRFYNPYLASYYASKFIPIHKKIQNSKEEYLDGLTIYMDFLYLSGQFKKATELIHEAEEIFNSLTEKKNLQWRRDSLRIAYDVYALYAHDYGSLFSNEEYYEKRICLKVSKRGELYCQLFEYMNDFPFDNIQINLLLNDVLSEENNGDQADFEILTEVIQKLTREGNTSLALEYTPLLIKNIDWSAVEKNMSGEYLNYRLIIANTYLKAKDLNKAKDEYLSVENIVKNNNHPENAFKGIMYTSLAEIALAQNNEVEARQYLEKVGVSITANFKPTDSLYIRYQNIKNVLSK